ncbi:hypothetical protein [Leptolyngbya ohadii]|uniref:hypothetical protein n=1 Tax=Leptolyngbya ohadii TaxID=1962290 RepID=UPI0011799A4A|nr:hypothetical protein [Leptolyngbya ohadii]
MVSSRISGVCFYLLVTAAIEASQQIYRAFRFKPLVLTNLLLDLDEGKKRSRRLTFNALNRSGSSASALDRNH